MNALWLKIDYVSNGPVNAKTAFVQIMAEVEQGTSYQINQLCFLTADNVHRSTRDDLIRNFSVAHIMAFIWSLCWLKIRNCQNCFPKT